MLHSWCTVMFGCFAEKLIWSHTSTISRMCCWDLSPYCRGNILKPCGCYVPEKTTKMGQWSKMWNGVTSINFCVFGVHILLWKSNCNVTEGWAVGGGQESHFSMIAATEKNVSWHPIGFIAIFIQQSKGNWKFTALSNTFHNQILWQRTNWRGIKRYDKIRPFSKKRGLYQGNIYLD